MLTEQEVREKIKRYCIEQDGCDLRIALKLEQRILGLCEALGAKERSRTKGLSRELLESVGINVVTVNPKWGFSKTGPHLPAAPICPGEDCSVEV
jgi:hypothetical protein